MSVLITVLYTTMAVAFSLMALCCFAAWGYRRGRSVWVRALLVSFMAALVLAPGHHEGAWGVAPWLPILPTVMFLLCTGAGDVFPFGGPWWLAAGLFLVCWSVLFFAFLWVAKSLRAVGTHRSAQSTEDELGSADRCGAEAGAD